MWHYKTTLITLAVIIAAVITTTAAADDIESFFQTFREKRDDIGALRAAFTQKTFLPDEVLTTQGTLYYSRPRRIMFATDNPERIILVDGRRGYEYDAEIRQLTIFDIEDNPRADIFFLGFDDDTETLQQAYQVQLMITHDARGRHGIKIEPRHDTDEEVYFMEVNLSLRDEDFLPYRIHIVNDAESQLFIDIDEIVTQTAADLDSARIFVPPGVKVIENDAVVDTIEGEGRYFPAENTAPQLHERVLPPQTEDVSAETSAPNQ